MWKISQQFASLVLTAQIKIKRLQGPASIIAGNRNKKFHRTQTALPLLHPKKTRNHPNSEYYIIPTKTLKRKVVYMKSERFLVHNETNGGLIETSIRFYCTNLTMGPIKSEKHTRPRKDSPNGSVGAHHSLSSKFKLKAYRNEAAKTKSGGRKCRQGCSGASNLVEICFEKKIVGRCR